MKELIRKILIEHGEFRVDTSGVAFYTWKRGTPNYIKQMYKGYKKSKQGTLL